MLKDNFICVAYIKFNHLAYYQGPHDLEIFAVNVTNSFFFQ